jgi:hypothetical protein
MIVKAAGLKSELLILTQQQREIAGSQAEKFDVAALVYNITSLEKLRWTIKNSENSRALLEATIVRFALSEHFLNVDSLLSRSSQSTSTESKKKVLDNPGRDHSPQLSKPAQSAKAAETKYDFQSLKQNWLTLLQMSSDKIGGAACALLEKASPEKLEKNEMTICFPKSAESSKKMCELPKRKKDMQDWLSELLGTVIKVNFDIFQEQNACEMKDQAKPSAEKSISEKKNDIMNDPAVKAVLLGLDATIMGFGENQ